MEGPNCYVILFDSTHQAMSAESALRSAGVRHAVINTPREFTVNCGISLRIAVELRDAAVAALDERGVVYAGVEPYRSRWV
ncbi:MAG: DUF3343 domain-containing protein [Actinobacteria bacterium]|nr:DUF3343 domain-containing protein [Actinomycetota bacterium]MDI6831749.1 DUF3343 domain-containing protein [Actinomycetota bacterium]